jgi:hypothetical protein
MISYDRVRKAVVFRQFHVEGFVNQYVSESVREGVVRFVSVSIENIPAGYRARETYTINGPDSFVERFELAAPEKEFELYSETRFQRKK